MGECCLQTFEMLTPSGKGQNDRTPLSVANCFLIVYCFIVANYFKVNTKQLFRHILKLLSIKYNEQGLNVVVDSPRLVEFPTSLLLAYRSIFIPNIQIIATTIITKPSFFNISDSMHGNEIRVVSTTTFSWSMIMINLIVIKCIFYLMLIRSSEQHNYKKNVFASKYLQICVIMSQKWCTQTHIHGQGQQ